MLTDQRRRAALAPPLTVAGAGRRTGHARASAWPSSATARSCRAAGYADVALRRRRPPRGRRRRRGGG
ncbi:MAG: hypothetical protein MZW92_12110 [Comamonadaceae bacterium]|nr:hypothetical protein [Comamonadaceae bacterium]